MFIYGQDIPLEDVRMDGEEAADPLPIQPIRPAELPFVYGKDIFPEQAAE